MNPENVQDLDHQREQILEHVDVIPCLLLLLAVPVGLLPKGLKDLRQTP